MKKTMLLLGALLLSAAAGYAQESRQDVSISATVPFAPQVTGNSVQKNSEYDCWFRGQLSGTCWTPRSALEFNYGYHQNTEYYQGLFGKLPGRRPHVLESEISASLRVQPELQEVQSVPRSNGSGRYSLYQNQRRWNDCYARRQKSSTGIGGIFGGGVSV